MGAGPVLASGADGTSDTAFTTNTGTGFSSQVRALAVQSDGKIIAGGLFTAFNGTTVDRIARLNADGTLDGSFTSNTLVGSVYAVAVQSDGKIIVGGAFTDRIARLNADGTTDTSFSRSASGLSSSVYALAVQSDGKIIVGGSFTNRIARLNADGTTDTSFSTGTGFNSDVQAVAVQSDGKIIAGGDFRTLNGVTVNYIARLDANGTPDTAFSTSTGTGFDGVVRAMAVQSDGKILVGGDFRKLNGVTVNYIARLLGGSAPDTNTGSSESGVPVFSLSFDSMPGVLISGAVGSWVSLPTLTNPPVTNPNSTFLGWTTYEEFPVAIAQRQIDNDWGAYEVFRDDGSLQDVFIPAEGSARIAAPESLYPIWSDSSA